MKKLSNLQAVGVKIWLMQEALPTWSKKTLNIAYEVETDYIFSFSFGHGDVLLVWVIYMVKVKYIHLCIMFLMHDKLTW